MKDKYASCHHGGLFQIELSSVDEAKMERKPKKSKGKGVIMDNVKLLDNKAMRTQMDDYQDTMRKPVSARYFLVLSSLLFS